jgi:lipopolysaccharide/colanic/teichoic acid biosynthesis glycosyltransferase
MEHGKRAFDFLASLLTLVLLSPALLLIALLVRLESPGPATYRQERVGLGGRSFTLLKFRSMVVGAEHKGAGILVEKDDARVTRAGKILRKLSLDELPQLYNVLRGDMSLVGPRPGLRYQAELYSERQRGRLLVRPGLTGWAQVRGRKGIDWPRRIELDLEYIERISLLLDLRILFLTVGVVLKGSDPVAASDYWKEQARLRQGEAAGGSAVDGSEANGRSDVV